jgi:diguanylate cyclase (GGDEF)-like protein/PAS domain S-box-containing protein
MITPANDLINKQIALNLKLSEELATVNAKLVVQQKDKLKRENELTIANVELAFQRKEKAARAAELVIANIELAYQRKEKANRADELLLANVELAFQHEEKATRAAELVIANAELIFQNKEKANRAAELVIANIKLDFHEDEKNLLSMAADRAELLDDIATQGIFTLDRHGNLLQSNPSFAAMLGYTESEMEGLNVRHWNAELSVTQITMIYNELTTSPRLFDTVHRRKDGTLVKTQVAAKIVQIEGEHYVYATVTDAVRQNRGSAKLELLVSCMAHSNDVVIITDAGLIDVPGPRIVFVNEAFGKLYGYTRDEAIGNTPRMLQGPKSDPATLSQIRIALSQWKSVRVELINYAKDGTEYWVELDITPVADANGRYTHVISVQRDITLRKANLEQSRKLSLAVEQSNESVIVTDLDGNIEYANDHFVRASGYSREELIGQHPRFIRSDMSSPEIDLAISEAVARGQSWRGEILNRRKDGSEYTTLTSMNPVCNATGEVTHFLISKEDVTEKKVAEAQIQHLAFYDSLTKLPNRSFLMNSLRQAVISSSRTKQFWAILFIDLDHFKTLNDTKGHDAGDELLIQMSARLLSCVRESDTIARFGGDEFVVMLKELSQDELESSAIAANIAKKILNSFEKPFVIQQALVQSSASIGITLFSGHRHDSAEGAIKQADLAMYTAKTTSRNTHRLFDPKMQSVVNARAAIATTLQIAMEGQYLCLAYQAQFNDLGEITGAEVLIRMNHPERGLITSREFIGIAEETGLITSMGYWVIQTACEQLVNWANDETMAHLTIAVNISARQFRDSHFVKRVLAIVHDTGANPALLKFEFTESALSDDFEEIIKKMTLLRAQGIRLSLDDFGTGVSSLANLRKLPLDQVKIDQSLVQDTPHDLHACSIVEAIITIAKSMKLNTIAEGVETKEQHQYLLNNGCQSYQGYLFSRPIALEQFDRLVRHHI